MVMKGRAEGRGRTAQRGTAPTVWTFFTNHAHVLFCLSREPDLRMREVAAAVGVTERAVQRIVADLEQAGYLRHERAGRRNRYEIDADRPLRHTIEAHCRVAELLRVLTSPARTRHRTG